MTDYILWTTDLRNADRVYTKFDCSQLCPSPNMPSKITTTILSMHYTELLCQAWSNHAYSPVILTTVLWLTPTGLRVRYSRFKAQALDLYVCVPA